MQTLKPWGDRVTVRRIEEEAKPNKPGLIMPEGAKEKPVQGIVVEVGPGRVVNGERLAMTAKKGDKVLFGKYAGSEFKINGQTLLLMREDEVLGALEGEEELPLATAPKAAEVKFKKRK